MDAAPEEMLKIADFHRRHGTTTLTATTMTDGMKEIGQAFDRITFLTNSGKTGTLHGVHMECQRGT